MSGLSGRERTAIEELWRIEQSLAQKCELYAGQTDDPQIREACERMAGKHQNHRDRLQRLLV